MPKVKSGERKKDFMSRCIPMVVNEGKEQDQAVAICSNIWEDSEAESKAKFIGSIRSLNEEQLKEMHLTKASMISEASSLVPDSLDTEKSFDVLPVVFNLAVVNSLNDNGDGITAIEAAKIVKQFVHKPVNIEHYKTDIVGHIINASFSDKQPDIMENDVAEFMDRKDPFYITAAAVIYKHVYPQLAEAIEDASDENSSNYNAYSTSWEIGFSEYDVSVGGKHLEECEMHSEGSDEFDTYKHNLKAFGGSGNSNKGRVGRWIKGKKLALGAALTENPAANVKGVYTLANLLNKENSSQNEKTNVNDKNVNYDSEMTDEQFDKLTAKLEKAIQDIKGDKQLDESKASAFSQIENTLKEAGKEWKSKAEASAEEAKEAKEDLEKLKGELSKASEELKELQENEKVREDAERLNARMSSINDAYDLSEAEESIVAKEVQSLGSEDADFDSYKEKLKVVFAHKDREFLKSQKEDVEEENHESEASKEDEVEESELEISESTKKGVTNNNGEHADENKTFVDRLRENGLALNTK